MVDSIDLLLINQRHDFLMAFDEAKMRFPIELKINVFSNLQGFVTPYALRLVFKEFKRLTAQSTALLACTNNFTTSLGLPCSHQIQARMFGNEGVLLIDDIHPHWRFERPPPIDPALAPENPGNPSNPLLHVQEPEVVRTRGRPAGAKNRRQRAFDDSTYREPSQFERAEAAIAAEAAAAIQLEGAGVGAEVLDLGIERALRCADSAPTRGRPLGWPRRQRRGWGRGRGRGRGRGNEGDVGDVGASAPGQFTFIQETGMGG